MKIFHRKAEPIYRLIEKESKSPNKYAQMNAKNLSEFLEFARMLYIKCEQLHKQARVSQALYTEAIEEVVKKDSTEEEQVIKDLWAKFSGNEEVRKNLKGWADMVIQERKHQKDGSKHSV